MEAGLAIRNQLHLGEAAEEFAAIQEAAQAGTIEFADAVRQRELALATQDAKLLKSATDKIVQLRSGEAEGRLSPMAARTRMASVVQEMSANNPLIANELRG